MKKKEGGVGGGGVDCTCHSAGESITMILFPL